jgi:hypothetical protein
LNSDVGEQLWCIDHVDAAARITGPTDSPFFYFF